MFMLSGIALWSHVSALSTQDERECLVPQNYGTIQLAINNSLCTLITINPGFYFESLVIGPRNQRLVLQGREARSEKPPRPVIIATSGGGQGDEGIFIKSGSHNVTIKGLIITGSRIDAIVVNSARDVWIGREKASEAKEEVENWIIPYDVPCSKIPQTIACEGSFKRFENGNGITLERDTSNVIISDNNINENKNVGIILGRDTRNIIISNNAIISNTGCGIAVRNPEPPVSLNVVSSKGNRIWNNRKNSSSPADRQFTTRACGSVPVSIGVPEIVVPDDTNDLQGAVSWAQDEGEIFTESSRDTICGAAQQEKATTISLCVSPKPDGSPYGKISINARTIPGLLLQGEESVTIKGDSESPVVRIAGSHPVTLAGFIIAEGDIGVSIQDISQDNKITIMNSFIQKNKSVGINWPLASGTVEVVNSKVEENDFGLMTTMLSGSTLVVRCSSIARNKRDGLLLGGSGFTAKFLKGGEQCQDAQITGNGGHGVFAVHLSGSPITLSIEDYQIAGNGGKGIGLQVSEPSSGVNDVRIMRSKIANNEVGGILVNTESSSRKVIKVALENSIISRNGRDEQNPSQIKQAGSTGISIQGSVDTAIANSDISFNTGTGLLAQCLGDAACPEISIKGGQLFPLPLDDQGLIKCPTAQDAQSSQTSGNMNVLSNVGAGINFQGGQGLIEKAQISCNQREGIRAGNDLKISTDLTVSGSSFLKNGLQSADSGFSGVQIMGGATTATINSSIVSANTGDGILVQVDQADVPHDVLISDNTMEENGIWGIAFWFTSCHPNSQFLEDEDMVLNSVIGDPNNTVQKNKGLTEGEKDFCPTILRDILALP